LCNSNAAVENPTALEAKIKADAAMRRLSHELRNEQNKLTPGERAAKKLAKITEDASGEMRVCIFRIADFSHKAHQFKVDINAKQLKLTGCAILWESYNVVIAEGGTKAMKRFMRVMQHRIKWDKTGNELDSESDDEDDNESAGAAKSAMYGSCLLSCCSGCVC
jgi:U4/U6 small nuclear ribonucleoprotein PRP3